MNTDELILTIVWQANQLRLAIEATQQLQRRIAELEAALAAKAEPLATRQTADAGVMLAGEGATL